MPKIVTLYHKEDGAVDFKSADVSEVLIHKDEWSDKPWTKDQVDQAPADPCAGRRRPAAHEKAAACR